MAYNNGFPIGYQPYYPQQYQVPVAPSQPNNPQPQNSGIIWVSGEAGAKAYLVAPNTTVQLWDSEDQVIYLKSADASGMPSMKVLDYTIRGAELPVNQLSADSGDFIHKDEFDALKSKIDRLEGEISKLRQRKEKRDGKPTVQLNAD